jgi:hypothetical protein
MTVGPSKISCEKSICMDHVCIQSNVDLMILLCGLICYKQEIFISVEDQCWSGMEKGLISRVKLGVV